MNLSQPITGRNHHSVNGHRSHSCARPSAAGGCNSSAGLRDALDIGMPAVEELSD